MKRIVFSVVALVILAVGLSLIRPMPESVVLISDTEGESIQGGDYNGCQDWGPFDAICGGIVYCPSAQEDQECPLVSIYQEASEPPYTYGKECAQANITCYICCSGGKTECGMIRNVVIKICPCN